MKSKIKHSIIIELDEDQARLLKETMRNPVGGGNPIDEDQEVRALRRELFDALEDAFPTIASQTAFIFSR